MEVDGAEQSEVINVYTFNTTGEHVVKYTLADPTSIGNGTFKDCYNLISVTIPNSVTSIGWNAFSYCSSLTSITIPSSVTNIGNGAFSECSSLTSVNISDLAAWCNIQFDDYYSNPLTYAHHLYINGNEITNLVIPNSITSIDRYAFYYCSGLTSVTIGNSVTSIDDEAFEACTGLTSVTIGNSVTSISSSAFAGCTGLTSVTIGNSVTTIREYAFAECSSLTSIVCNATIAPTIQSSTFNNIKTDGILTVPSGSTGYDVWMGTDNYYLGMYNWTKVEQ